MCRFRNALKVEFYGQLRTFEDISLALIRKSNLFHKERGARLTSVVAPIGIHLRTLKNDKKPPICAFFSCLQQASQASDVGSIPIARSINPDSVALPLLKLKNGANWPEFWTQLGPNFFPTSDFPVRFSV